MTIATDCLAISELLKNIFDLLKPSERRRSLCSVALTCRTLSEPALDELWDTLPGLWPLLELFPDDVIAKEKQVQEDRGIHRHFVSPRLSLLLLHSDKLSLPGSGPATLSDALGRIHQVLPSCP